MNPALEVVVARHRQDPLHRMTVLAHTPLTATVWRAGLRAQGCDRVEVLDLTEAHASRVPLAGAVVFVETAPTSRRSQMSLARASALTEWLSTAAETVLFTPAPEPRP